MDLKIDLHGLTLTQQTAAVINLDSLEPLAGRRIDGLVGVDIFRRYVVEIDYIGHKVKLYEPTTYRYGGNGEVLQLALESNYLFTHASVETAPNRTITGKFLLDTGGGLVAVVLTTPFVKSSNILSSLRKTIRDDTLTALGGDVKVVVGRAHSFRPRTLVIPQPIIHLSRNQSGALASAHLDGVIGAELLNKFRVIFDYSRRRLILEPNVTFRQAMEYNRTGISVRANGERFDAFTVHQIIEDSPGSDAGVQKGDVLVRINGRAAHEFTMDSIYKMFKENQSILRLTLSRGNRTVQAEIKPRRLI